MRGEVCLRVTPAAARMRYAGLGWARDRWPHRNRNPGGLRAPRPPPYKTLLSSSVPRQPPRSLIVRAGATQPRVCLRAWPVWGFRPPALAEKGLGRGATRPCNAQPQRGNESGDGRPPPRTRVHMRMRARGLTRAHAQAVMYMYSSVCARSTVWHARSSMHSRAYAARMATRSCPLCALNVRSHMHDSRMGMRRKTLHRAVRLDMEGSRSERCRFHMKIKC